MLMLRHSAPPIALVMILGGCGGSGSDDTPQVQTPAPPISAPVTGNLDVRIIGLPMGVSAEVVITGPSNFTQTITQSTTFVDLSTGDYSIAVSPSNIAGVVYDVLPATRQVTVDEQGSAETLIFQAPTLSEGIISNFGSVFVNGVQFDTSDASVSTDDIDDATENDLDVGMFVTVIGRSSADGSNAQANEIQYRVSAEGPIEDISLADETLQVLSQTFSIDELTQFPSTSFERLVIGDIVEISAFQNPNESTVATRVSLENDNDMVFRVRGILSNLNEQQQRFDVSNITVDFSNAEVDGLLANNAEVAVTAEMALDNKQLIAGDVEVLDIDEDERQQAIDGVISVVTSATQIRVGGFIVNIDDETDFDAGSVASLRDGIRVRVFGVTTEEGILNAQNIRLVPESDIALIGRLGLIDADDSTLEILGNEYEVDEHSILQDRSDAAIRRVNLNELSIGDLIEVSAFEGDDGLLIRQLTRLSTNAPNTINETLIELEGGVTAINADSFNVQGVTISATPFTEFDFDDEELTLDQFNNILAIGDEVEVDGIEQADGSIVAISVELENDDISENSHIVELEGNIAAVASDTTFNLNGRQVLIDSFTQFEDGNVSDIGEGRDVEVRGREGEQGRILAIRITFEDSNNDDKFNVEFEGVIEGINTETEISVAGQIVTVTDSTEFENGTVADLMTDVQIDVTGRLTDEGLVEASNIEFEDQDEIEVGGTISSFTSSTQFFIGEQEISTNGATAFENGNASALNEGILIEATGELVNDILVAEEIEFTDSELTEIEGVVSTITDESSFTLQEQLILINEFTEFDDGEPSDIEVGVVLSVEGRINSEGVLVAASIEFTDETSD